MDFLDALFVAAAQLDGKGVRSQHFETYLLDCMHCCLHQKGNQILKCRDLVVVQFSCLVAFFRKNEFLKCMPVACVLGPRKKGVGRHERGLNVTRLEVTLTPTVTFART